MRDEQPTEVLPALDGELDESTNGHLPAGAASSVWEALRARREALAADRHLDLEVPGTGGLLTLRLGPISGQKQAQLTARLQKSRSPERDFNLNADYLIASCRAILGRDDPRHPLEVLLDEDGEPFTLGTVAPKLGLATDTPVREVVRYLFGFAPSPEVAVTIAGGEYVTWAGAVGADLDEELLGEA